MLQWQVRVIAEKRELDERLEKLTAFIQSPAFGNVTEPEATLLRVQRIHMGGYSKALEGRIASWQEKPMPHGGVAPDLALAGSAEAPTD